VVIDEDCHVFNVVGPLQSDREWNEKIVEMQGLGRNVRCYARHTPCSRDSIIAEISKSSTYRFSEHLILEEPEDMPAEYEGSLPAYAKNTDRKRVVQIMCKSTCGSVRWGVKKDFPRRVYQTPRGGASHHHVTYP
jgi:hypothetical protein